jgi:hypothetical protein
VNPVVGRHQVEIEAAGNPREYTQHIPTNVHENREGKREERDLVADMLILLFEVTVGASTRVTPGKSAAQIYSPGQKRKKFQNSKNKKNRVPLGEIKMFPAQNEIPTSP